MTEEKDPLDEIFVDANEPAIRLLVADILKPLVTIDPQGNIDFLQGYDKINNQKKALIYLIVKKAMKLKGLIEDELSLKTEVSKKGLISENDANNAFSNTYKKLVINRKGKGYFVPDYNIKKVKALVSKKEKNE